MEDRATSLDISRITSPEQWRYLNEGGANTVYGYRDASHPNLGDKVLRIPKPLQLQPAEQNIEGRRLAQATFEAVLLPVLLNKRFLPQRQRASVSPQWLAELEEQEEASRPAHRTSDQRVDRDGMQVEIALMKNLLAGDAIIAVEIKPKWGFLPSSTYLSPSSLPIKSAHCRFCLHQHYRSVTSHDVSTLTSPDERYCPLDLYSGEVQRVGRAVDALKRMWTDTGGEGNNLRVYHNGRILRPDDLSLTVNLEGLQRSMIETATTSGVFKDLSRIQHALDPIDIEGLSKLYRDTKGENEASQLDRSVTFKEDEPSPEELKTFAKKLDLDRVDPHCQPIITWSLRDFFLAYALSATFKDCSVIIRYRENDPHPPGSQFGYDLVEESITIIDLDLKPMSNLNKWAKLDQAIWQAYRDHPPHLETTCEGSAATGIPAITT